MATITPISSITTTPTPLAATAEVVTEATLPTKPMLSTTTKPQKQQG